MTVSKASLFTSLLITSSLLFAGCSATNTSTNSNKDHQATTEKQVTKSDGHQSEKKRTQKAQPLLQRQMHLSKTH